MRVMPIVFLKGILTSMIYLQSGTRICLQAIGPNCVLQAVSSIAVARKYLENDCIDVCFRPEFIEVTREDGQVRNALRFSILVHQI